LIDEFPALTAAIRVRSVSINTVLQTRARLVTQNGEHVKGRTADLSIEQTGVVIYSYG